MEAYLPFGFGGDEQLDAEGDERDLYVTGPVGTCQDAPRGQLHPMIEIFSRNVKIYQVVKSLRRQIWQLGKRSPRHKCSIHTSSLVQTRLSSGVSRLIPLFGAYSLNWEEYGKDGS